MKNFNVEPPAWYKTIILTSIPVFLTSILGVLWVMQGDIGSVKQASVSQQEAFVEYKLLIEKYIDKNDQRLARHEDTIDKIGDHILDHEYRIKDIEKKVN